MSSPKKFTRESLYSIVWTKPLNKLANELNIEEYLLRKICQEYNIPLPKSGHWSKVAHGKNVEIPKLPNKRETDELIIDLEVKKRTYEDTDSYKLKKRAEEIQSEFAEYCKVKDRLTRPHPLIISVRKELIRQRPSRWGGHEELIWTRSGNISIHVSKGLVGRYLRFIDAFNKLLEKRDILWALSWPRIRCRLM